MKSGSSAAMRATTAGSFTDAGTTTGTHAARARSATDRNQTRSPGSSACVTTSGTSAPSASSSSRHVQPTSWYAITTERMRSRLRTMDLPDDERGSAAHLEIDPTDVLAHHSDREDQEAEKDEE